MVRARLLCLAVVACAVLPACGSPSLPTAAAEAVSITAVRDVGSSPHGRLDYHRPLRLPPSGPYLAVPTHRFIPVYRSPAAKAPLAFIDTRNPIGQQFRMPVREVLREGDGSGWMRVVPPSDGFPPTVWVRSDDARGIRLLDRIVVSLSTFTLERYHDGALAERFRVALGRPEFPTPTGTYYVWARVPQGMPNGPYGVFALGTTAISSVIEGGRVAIHGTVNPSDPGRRVSHGCIRVYNLDMLRLRDVPMGTPVVIRP